MRLNHGVHLAYCTNIHRGETWAETFEALNRDTLRVAKRVCPSAPYGIGLRLSNQAAVELNDRAKLLEFHRWLDRNHCYIFTINGFPYGQFHGTRVKEQVYWPDWTTPERLAYTNLLVDLLAQLLPADVEGSVSTMPCGFKPLICTSEERKLIRDNLWRCVEHTARVSAQSGRKLHVGLEPEPMCLLETTAEVVQLFDRLRAEHRNDPRLMENLGVTYDTCHLAVEFEEPQNSLALLQAHKIKVSKIHLSTAIAVRPTREARQALAEFDDGIYLHQVVVRQADGTRSIYLDLDDALACEHISAESDAGDAQAPEWRVHFHIPLHSEPGPVIGNTTSHLLGVLDLLQANPSLCRHLEMETYTWEVLPAAGRSSDVVDQLEREYRWTLGQLAQRALATVHAG